MTNNRLDLLDLQILELLQQNAMLTHREIGDRLYKSQTPINIRVKRLEKEGYIKKYVALINPGNVGCGLTAFTHVKLRKHSQQALQTFGVEVSKLKSVMECYHLTGAFDFLLRIAIANLQEYNNLLMCELANLPDVGTMETFFVLSELKNETAYPIDRTIANDR